MFTGQKLGNIQCHKDATRNRPPAYTMMQSVCSPARPPPPPLTLKFLLGRSRFTKCQNGKADKTAAGSGEVQPRYGQNTNGGRCLFDPAPPFTKLFVAPCQRENSAAAYPWLALAAVDVILLSIQLAPFVFELIWDLSRNSFILLDTWARTGPNFCLRMGAKAEVDVTHSDSPAVEACN